MHCYARWCQLFYQKVNIIIKLQMEKGVFFIILSFEVAKMQLHGFYLNKYSINYKLKLDTLNEYNFLLFSRMNKTISSTFVLVGDHVS